MKLYIIIIFLFASASSFGKGFKKCLREAITKRTPLKINPRPWKVSKDVENKIQQIMNDSNLRINEKVNKAFLLLVDDKIKNLSPAKIKRIKESLDSIGRNTEEFKEQLRKSNIKLGAYYPYWNEIFVPGGKTVEELNVNQLNTAIHEFFHSYSNAKFSFFKKIALNENKFSKLNLSPDLIYPFYNYIDEQHAIGAQWELLSRIPSEQLKKITDSIDKLESYYNFKKIEITDDEAKKIIAGATDNGTVVSSLISDSVKYSRLSKNEFIEKMRITQAKTLKEVFIQNNKYNKGKYAVLPVIILAQLGYHHFFGEENQNGENDYQIYFPIDIAIISAVLNEVFSEEE